MKLKIIVNNQRLHDIGIEKDKTYEVDSIVEDSYKIKIPMKRKNKFRFALVNENEGILI